MTIESVNNDPDDFAHVKLERDIDNFAESFFINFAYYRQNVPDLLRCIIFIAVIAALVLVAELKGDELFGAVIVIVGGLVVAFYIYMCGFLDGMDSLGT